MRGLTLLDVVEEEDEVPLATYQHVSSCFKHADISPLSRDLKAAIHSRSPCASLTTSSLSSSPLSVQHYSSPLSNANRYESPASSPLDPPEPILLYTLSLITDEQILDELTTRFDLTLRSARVPKNTAGLLAEMKSVTMMIRTMLPSGSRQILPIEVENLRRIKLAADWLISSLRQAQAAVQKEIMAIRAILQLAPFTTRPAPEDLWANYKQMAELILQ